MRRLRVVAPGDGVLGELRAALAGGDAILVAPQAAGASGAAAAGATDLDLPRAVERRVALVVQTSGSTGRPKRVALSADALLANAAASESALGGPGQWVLAVPTHYIAGLNVLARSLAAETEPVTARGDHFTAAAFLDAVERMSHPTRFTSLVPAQLATLLDDPRASAALAGFAAVLVGGQASPRALLDRAAQAGIPVRRSYGSSETSGGCVYDGVPIGATTVKLVGGEVWLGGPSLAEGYLGDPELTAERFVHEAGVLWFRTADGGQLATGSDGDRLTVTGRRDDVLISGGVKVALAAVERVLRELPGFGDAVVVAVPDERWGEVPVVVVGEDGAGHPAIRNEDRARAAIVAELGVAARPARFIRLDTLPLLSSGKVDRLAVRTIALGAPR